MRGAAVQLLESHGQNVAAITPVKQNAELSFLVFTCLPMKGDESTALLNKLLKPSILVGQCP